MISLQNLRLNRLAFYLCPAIILFFSCRNDSPLPADTTDWPSYLGGPSTSQYSALTQIDRDNVARLEVAWTYNSGDADPKNRSQIQCNPIIINGVLYATSPVLNLFALDAATGSEMWVFKPFENEYDSYGMGVNRGVAYWTDGQEERILYTVKSFLFAVDAKTGKPIRSFGDDGKVSLHKGLGRDVDDLFISSNTPGIVFEDLLILGQRVSEDMGAAPGHIRAFNVRSGEIEWIFHTIPQPGEFGYETWPADAWKEMGGANAWSGFSLDKERGVVYVPTGSASYDFYGGDRPGENLFANCVIALNARTGERIWHYQTVRHDLWDRDLPAPPTLVTVEHEGRSIDAVAQITKSSHIFLLNRDTGEPLFPVKEVPVPPSKLKGEQAWPTQPIPERPPVFSRERVQAKDLTNLSSDGAAHVKMRWGVYLEGEPFIPPSEQGTIIFPGLDGGGEWGGGAYDPESGNLFINASEMPWILQMLPYREGDDGLLATRGENVYRASCIGCHGPNMRGASVHPVPSIRNLKERMQKEEVIEIVRNGKGMMPSFGYLEDEQITAVAAYLLDSKEPLPESAKRQNKRAWKYPYALNGYQKFLDPDGYPAINPPWGTLNAVNLNTGVISWKVTLGEYPELVERGITNTGSESYGGPVVTASGLIFIAGTLDEKIRAFDKRDGRLLWEAKLPAAGFATPAVYAVGGKQYVVIACGGGKLGRKSGDAYVAFALPDEG